MKFIAWPSAPSRTWRRPELGGTGRRAGCGRGWWRGAWRPRRRVPSNRSKQQLIATTIDSLFSRSNGDRRPHRCGRITRRSPNQRICPWMANCLSHRGVRRIIGTTGQDERDRRSLSGSGGRWPCRLGSSSPQVANLRSDGVTLLLTNTSTNNTSTNTSSH